VLTEDGALGNVTMYSTSPSSGGACQYGKTGVAYYAALQVNLEPGDGLGQWQAGRRCGDCARVTVLTSAGQRQVVVRIMDKCPDGDCGLDLGGDAPEAVMADGFGRYAGGWEFIPCTGHPEVFDGPPSLFVKEGSNAWWSAVQVRNPNLAVAALHWSGPEGTGDFDYQGAELENYYLVPAALLQSSAEVKITVEYRDASTQTVSLAGSELAVEGALYPLQG